MIIEEYEHVDTDTLEMAALRTVLEELENYDRMLVALHYGGDLTHEELARELGCPLWSIILELRSIQLVLCDRMRACGFSETAVIPALLKAALLKGDQTPPEIHTRLRKNLEQMFFGTRAAQGD